MIIDTQQIDKNTELRGSIVIIGAGAAGITLAMELARDFKDVLVLESGNFELEQETQSLYEGPVLGYPNTDIGWSRLRYLGGTTNHWEGQCAPFDSVDFEPVAGRSHSGWPITLDILGSFYERAYRYCELGGYRKTSPFLDQAQSAARRIVDSPDLELTEFRYSPPTRFGTRFRADLKSSDRIKVYLHANVTNISIAQSGRAVDSLQLQTLTGQRLKVTAAAFILCCGGVENPRILLNCTDFFPNGIGNERDLVGRFFMDHLSTIAGTIVPRNEASDFSPFAFRHDGPTRVMAALKNSAETVRRDGRRGCSFIMHPEFDVADFLLEEKNSASISVFKELVRNAQLGQIPTTLGARECIVLNDVGTIAKFLYYRVAETIRNKGALKRIIVHLEGEQAPNPDSRVVLVEERDALGMRRAGLDWRITTEDRNNLFQSTMELARGVGASGFGRMLTQIGRDVEQPTISTIWHHMGTTRMHDDKQQGVVDGNCRVHGLDNLFIAGSSVFPTGSRVNPTLTILALAIRLSDHLKRKVKSE